MKGYVVANGYMGYLPSVDKYLLFATEEEYVDIYEEESNNEEN